jgi:copper chaperone CopZ
MHGTEYCHILDGRIRIKVPEVKGSHAKAGEMESELAKLNGVAHVTANPLTGNVLVLFDSQVINHYHVVAVMKDLNCLNEKASVSPRSHNYVSQFFLQSVTELVLERVIMAVL